MDKFSQSLRHWRGLRRYSQLALASEAGVSARHLSFLESERARPSRDMVISLCDALSIPNADRNRMLEAAGFAAIYPVSALNSAEIAPAREGLVRVLERHDPFPGILLDREWRLLRFNAMAKRLFSLSGLSEGDSTLRLLETPGLMASMIENWPEVGHHMLLRLKAESRAAGGISSLDHAIRLLERDPDVQRYTPKGPVSPVLPTIYRVGDVRLSLFSTYLQIGGAEDLSLTDLKVELMMPADEASRNWLEAAASSA
ncbi:Transcriptional regulator, contains XRE-family HTH domain [Aliiroseovarius halocynthiae]|uniref:Helix-turn-helix transcriptional regulator n=1 Tax=Aliiroseovarius halocynthiae TaxID=985055 RepID=A0A545SW96_9RHOB|nr:helix-turn-helix transcriptional regulator [Aliiroseovarius halocynthiae]TQV69233.1 helix-turn-helix transcriptional regulator [Aliiroseovarius halocynthiae]SMR72000.1 Transcriptional regulator, contains XRE-family HTH domain [Aliiroseovarius halocynthiae]